MKVRFQADADLDGRILRGLRRVAPEIDIRAAADARLAGAPDIQVLRRAFEQGRVLVSQDRRTMPVHFRQYMSAGAKSSGLLLLRERGLAQTSALGLRPSESWQLPPLSRAQAAMPA